MNQDVARRRFLQGMAACGASLVSGAGRAEARSLDFPRVDLHVHLDGGTIDKVLELPQAQEVKFGIVEHAGTKENVYPNILSNDAELEGHLAMLEGKPVYKGIQAEWTDWMDCFSKTALAKLDYVLTDALTFPGPGGRRMKLWEKGAEIPEAQTFMDQYVDWHVKIMAEEPIDILANVSWLPASLTGDYDALWTDARIEKIVNSAVKYQVAIEINSGFRLPKLFFLETAKAAGVKFTFGSNGRYPRMGRLAYSIELAEKLGLHGADMFSPAPEGKKAVQRRMV